MDWVTRSRSIPKCKLALLHGEGQMFVDITPCLNPSEAKYDSGNSLLAEYMLHALASTD